MESPPKIMIVAGESSGDYHAARLVRSFKERRPDADIYGIGGSGMRAEGVRLIRDISELSTFGVFEVFKQLPRLAGVFFRALGSISEERPDVVVLVDYPDFNIRLARAIRWRYGKKPLILYYIAPQVWIWRKWRVKTLGKLVDRLAVVFPFEKALFDNLGAKVHFVGHPLLDDGPASDNVAPDLFASETAHGKKIALLPGSRHGELKNYMPALLDAVKILSRDERAKYDFFFIKAPSFDYSDFKPYLDETSKDIRIVEGSTRALLKQADFAVVALGTATLETALAGIPAAHIGKVSLLSYIFGKHCLGMNLDYYSLVNFILGRPAFPELIQHDVTGEKIAETISQITGNDKAINALKSANVEVSKKLESKNEEGLEGATASQRAAFILDEMAQESRK